MRNKVRVIKAFTDDPRTPCPAVGTVGEWRHKHDGYILVRFTLPMTTHDGSTFLPHDEKTYLDIRFRPDEIEAI